MSAYLGHDRGGIFMFPVRGTGSTRLYVVDWMSVYPDEVG